MSAGAGPQIMGPGSTNRLADAVSDAFVDRHGRRPDGVWAAPGRVNLIGEHTDHNGGPCLPLALPHATYVAVGRRTDRRLTAVSDRAADVFDAPPDRLGPGDVTGWPAYVAGVVWAAREAGVDVPGLDVVISSTVPVGAGLSSSAALECSIGLAALSSAGVTDDEASRRRLVEMCRRAESEVAGAPTGGMDQTVSLFASVDHALLVDFSSAATRDVVGPAISRHRWTPATDGVELVVIDTRTTHALVDGGYADRRRECERAATLLDVRTLGELVGPDSRDSPDARDAVDSIDDEVLRRRARHVVTEIGRVRDSLRVMGRAAVAEDPGGAGTVDWATLGSILDASHASLRDDFEVSCPELDAACDVAVRAGAFGARMTGGGFGGSAIALVPSTSADEVRRRVADEFADRGWAPPGFLPAPASAGASRIA